MTFQPADEAAASKGSASLSARVDDLHRQLVEGVSDYAIYMLNPSGHVISWNKGAQRVKGYTPTEIIGRHFSVFYTAEDRTDGRPQRALSTAATEGRFEDRAWRVRKDGSQFRAHVIIDRILGEDGGLVGYAKITRDISDSYAQELALRESEQRFRLLVTRVTDYAIYMLDLNGMVNSWNAGAERFKGYRQDEIIGRHFSLFYTQEDRANGKPARALGLALREGRYEESGWRLRKDGRQFWAHVVIDLIHDDQGHPIGFAKITRDVSERRAADLRLRDLSRANEELEQFIHIASHDLREPLRKVLSFSDLLFEEEGSKLAAQSLGYLRSITSATQRMQDLLASLLDLTRVTSQGRPFDPCPLNGVLNDVCSDLEILIEERGAVVNVDVLPSIEADTAQMRQLFQNLIDNALKYSRDGLPPHIVIREVPDPDPCLIAISVSDNGIGFDEQYCERIFGVFQRLHARDRYGGSGIGLAICRKICLRHGGRISACAIPMQGAVFTVRLARRHIVK